MLHASDSGRCRRMSRTISLVCNAPRSAVFPQPFVRVERFLYVQGDRPIVAAE
jgi:hypothetical protein